MRIRIVLIAHIQGSPIAHLSPALHKPLFVGPYTSIMAAKFAKPMPQAVVTGANSGIGLAFAKLLNDEVHITD